MRDPLISEPDQSHEKRYLSHSGSRPSQVNGAFCRQFGGACHRLARNRSEYAHSYSDYFARFDSFNSFSVDSFDFELAFH